MTQTERFKNVLLATTLGRVFPLWGIIEGEDGKPRCECKNYKICQKEGKHPREAGWKKRATVSPYLIKAAFELFPNANWGVVMGENAVAIDADTRPEEGKFGTRQLDYLELDNGQRLPYSVTVLSGGGNGSKHIFFQVPPVPLDSLSNPFNGVEFIKYGYCVTPGSKHISGNDYKFESECGPVEQALAEMPEFLLDALAGVKVKVSTANVGEQFDPLTAVPPGRRRPDYIVERQIHRDRIAGPLFEGIRQTRKKNGDFDRSRDDFRLCRYLAFYTSHHWDQYCRSFEKSGLYGDKPSSDYVERTLRRAFVLNPVNWVDKKRKSKATGVKAGRKMSADTTMVISIHEENPALTAPDIAVQVGCTTAKVRNVLHRYRHGFYLQRPPKSGEPL